VLLPSVTPPASSDWIGGAAGVDEELIDEFDNDYDGIKDEDARNLKGYDDDDDAQVTMLHLGNLPVAVMAWQDAPDHVNHCPDIDVTQPMNRDPLVGNATVDSLLKRQNCIGSLEHRLYLAKRVSTDATYLDSLIAYYSAQGDPRNSADTVKNCMDDYRRKLSQTYKDALGITDAVANVACRFKHIWIAPIPPRSEWTSGVFGLDEERYDCIDNDGDGWIDEDLDDRRAGPCWSP
jgi:hypothetical protein